MSLTFEQFHIWAFRCADLIVVKLCTSDPYKQTVCVFHRRVRKLFSKWHDRRLVCEFWVFWVRKRFPPRPPQSCWFRFDGPSTCRRWFPDDLPAALTGNLHSAGRSVRPSSPDNGLALHIPEPLPDRRLCLLLSKTQTVAKFRVRGKNSYHFRDHHFSYLS